MAQRNFGTRSRTNRGSSSPKQLDSKGKNVDQNFLSRVNSSIASSAVEIISADKGLAKGSNPTGGREAWGRKELEVTLVDWESKELNGITSVAGIPDGFMSTIVKGTHEVTTQDGTFTQNIYLLNHLNMERATPQFETAVRQVRKENPDASDAEVYQMAAEMLTTRREWVQESNERSKITGLEFSRAVASAFEDKQPGDVIRVDVMSRYLVDHLGLVYLVCDLYGMPDEGILHSDFRPREENPESNVEDEIATAAYV